ncbi:MAG: septum formation initiator family protein [Spirochaetales bacterium]|nr:septum formation initiator family protein [Spirochaetales bacterium]
MSHFVTAALVSVVVALAGNLLVAPYSSEGYAALNARRARLETNIAELNALHATLGARIELLTRSSDAVRVEARNLGYYAENETIIRPENASRPQILQSPGRVILGIPEHTDRRALVRLVALLSGVVAFVSLLLLDPPDHRSISRASR